jgi:hypothetical protein
MLRLTPKTMASNPLYGRGIASQVAARLLALLLMASGSAISAENPTAKTDAASKTNSLSPYRANYSAKFSGMTIEAEQRLEEIEPGIYRESLVAKNFLGKIDEQSTFELTADERLCPTEYHYIRSVLGRDRTEKQTFDWPNLSVRYQKNDRTSDHDLSAGQLDLITQRLQLRRDIKAGQTALSYSVMSRGKTKQYDYRVVAEEVLETAIGPLNVVKVEKITEGDDDRQITVWLATDWDYLIVKLQQSQDGDSHQLELRSAEVNSIPVTPLTTKTSPLTDDQKL